jgi:UDP-N-acetylmuramoyl-L-alanyl-D-glutamate--2,6-diaminopimelate ligase
LFTFEFADLAVINIDDAYGIKLAAQTELPVMSVSRYDQSATWHFVSITQDYMGAHVAIRGSGGILIEGKVQLHGGYNYDNLLMAVAIATESGIDPIDIAAILPHLSGAVGRLESVRLGQNFTALVDYAHSPDAVLRVLETAHEITDGRVIAVLGCGGDRDRSTMPKRATLLLFWVKVMKKGKRSMVLSIPLMTAWNWREQLRTRNDCFNCRRDRFISWRGTTLR